MIVRQLARSRVPFATCSSTLALKVSSTSTRRTLALTWNFPGSTSTALNTISSAASNYLSNIARTVQLYADRYGSELTLEQVLLRTLAENGVAGPRELALHVKNDVGLYGARLDAIDARLRAKRSEQLDAAESGATDDVPGEHSLEARDGEGYLT